MKLLQINTTCNKGSTGRIAESIAYLARENNWETYLIHGSRYVAKSKMITLQSVTSFQEKLHALYSILFDSHGLGSTLETRKIIKKIDIIKPDIIHLHNIHGYYINYKILFEYLEQLNIPIVWTLHDCWSITGHCYHFDSIGCEKWKVLCHNCPLLREYPKSLFIDRSSRNYLLKKRLFSSIKNITIVSVSHWIDNLIGESFLNLHKHTVINNGVDLNIFKPTDSNLRSKLGLEKEFVILGVANKWSKNKGLNEFILLSKNENYKIILVGVSPDIKKILPRNIIAVEHTNGQKELATYYSIADVMVNPTYNDTFPTVNLESLACGTPVITYRTGGSPESISEDSGIIVDRGNYNELVQAIEYIRTKGKIFYAKACRQRAEKYYNQNERFQDYINLYKELVKEK